MEPRYIDKYYIDVDAYDMIYGYRADDSYLAIAKQFARGEVGLNILERLLTLGSFGVQVCLKSQQAYTRLRFINVYEVDYKLFHTPFMERDAEARRRMKELVNSPDNDLSQTIESII
ncbi:MAG: DUF3990 domain-containing protein [Clostridiales bacterium]|nr:DUF3990 domain-containing protein [Clostridiales bacterium]